MLEDDTWMGPKLLGQRVIVCSKEESAVDFLD